MIEQILLLRDKGFSFRKIAKELNTTVGKVQYRYQKHVQQQETPEEENIHFTQSIPASYDRDEITLLPQSSTVLYTFWELSGTTRELVEHQTRLAWSEIQKQIRIYDCTMVQFDGHNAHRFMDIDIPEMTNNWIVRGLEPNRTYIVDFGIRTRQNTFLSLIRSNAIECPRVEEGLKGIHVDAVNDWKNGQSEEPKWLEHFSTYSYYEKVK
ncbi:DUF4912 domain-containing protein [Halalkalibacter akibai]|uniref:DUF4912 domain-containing protein n=1 Tax=Halalkalibacter akibai (strain ATCC 43226 / DSM 21942 / CIP 109018 / JCM 9157 / 1139) TaxID=1236973 RepID=W4QQ50_HALA3|nr:DUF4912 domain-containing protein [Halalkalibacter akibai]GAE33449.1 hypothetical protein JCM9157_452 [Halalkalibacter akibai JCM 9157]